MPSTPSEPAVDANAMNAAAMHTTAAEPLCGGVGRNQRRTQSYDSHCNHCFFEHEDLASLERRSQNLSASLWLQEWIIICRPSGLFPIQLKGIYGRRAERAFAAP
jgi:hypothetical protein